MISEETKPMTSSSPPLPVKTEEPPPERSTSAPPTLELQRESLFAFNVDWDAARLFTDIRYDESYLSFYQAYADQAKLPPPLEKTPLIEEEQAVQKILERRQSFEAGSPPATHFSNRNHRNVQASDSPRRSPLPRKIASMSLEDFSLDENSLIPELSSDSESIYSSTDDLLTLVAGNPQNHVSSEGFYQHDMAPLGSSVGRDGGPAAERHLWEDVESAPPGTAVRGGDIAVESSGAALAAQANGVLPFRGPAETFAQPGFPPAVSPRHPPPPHSHHAHHPHAAAPPPVGIPLGIPVGVPPIGMALPPHAANVEHFTAPAGMPLFNHGPMASHHPMPPHGTAPAGRFFGQAPKGDPMAQLIREQLGATASAATATAGTGTASPTKMSPRGGAAAANTGGPSPLCRYFLQGYCSRGNRCNFAHIAPAGGAGAAAAAADGYGAEGVDSGQGAAALAFGSGSDSNGFLGGEQHPTGSRSSGKFGAISPTSAKQYGNGDGGANGKFQRNPTPTAAPPPQRLTGGPFGAGTAAAANGSSSTPPAVAAILSGTAPGSTSPPSSAKGTDGLGGGGPFRPKHNLDANAARYTPIDQVAGHIYELCKDQHGCRFLQKKLEENEPTAVDVIFNEVIDHIVELMTDPFGNYLCQKLIEHCSPQQRLTIVQRVAPELVRISKNMHGTRAVQKLIDFLTTPPMIALVINALRPNVVALIQDLNGNHVIQRCLNKLAPPNNQFIYDAVSKHCIDVATHRHGCCVLQRCIDHANEAQKLQLVGGVTANALELVQDAYGNYVVQYVLDLGYPEITRGVIERFQGHIGELSTQKFSSNVIEKCLNVADPPTRQWIVAELLQEESLPALLQDPFANYVIQTALTIANPVQHKMLVEAIRPHLTALRNTPYGKRIQNKILKESKK